MPVPYPKIVLVGFGAGGSDGKASAAPEPRVCREADAVGRVDDGFTEDEGPTQGVVVTREVGPPERLGKAEAAEDEETDGGAAGEETTPQDPVRETEEREDCAVEDLSFRTRDVLFGGAVCAVDGVDAVTCAQPCGRELLFIPLGPGREG